MMIDEYMLIKAIGKGAFGEVYLTTKQGSKQLFATKKVPKIKADSPNVRKYFLNELQILREVNHKYIIHFETMKHTIHNYYIITEFCNGGGLYDCLNKYKALYGTSFPEEIVQHLMRQIVEGVKYLHSKRIIHRDLKLENILVNFENEMDKNNLNMLKSTVKIIDFGFATHLNSSNLTYSAIGSPINMDPLLLKKLSDKNGAANYIGYDEKADIWSLGTVCYEMLIGEGVFNAQNMTDLIRKVEYGTYHVPTNLSKEVVSFLNGMLQYSAKNRLSAEQLSRHYFLTKNVRDFKKIDLTKVSHKVDGNGLNINIKRNQSIWGIFREEDEKTLIDIPGNYLNDLKPIPEVSEENPFKKANDNINTNILYNNNILGNNNKTLINNNNVLAKNNNNNNLVYNNILNNNNLKEKEIDYNLLSQQQKLYYQQNLKNNNNKPYANYVYNNTYTLAGLNNNNVIYNNNYDNGQQKYYSTNLNGQVQIQSKKETPLQSTTNVTTINPIQNNQMIINQQYPQIQYVYTTQPQIVTTVTNPVIIQQGYYQQTNSQEPIKINENQNIKVNNPIIISNQNSKNNKLNSSKISEISTATTKTTPINTNMKQYTYYTYLDQPVDNLQKQQINKYPHILQLKEKHNQQQQIQSQNQMLKKAHTTKIIKLDDKQNQTLPMTNAKIEKINTITYEDNYKPNIKITKLGQEKSQYNTYKYSQKQKNEYYTTQTEKLPAQNESQNQTNKHKYISHTYNQKPIKTMEYRQNIEQKDENLKYYNKETYISSNLKKMNSNNIINNTAPNPSNYYENKNQYKYDYHHAHQQNENQKKIRTDKSPIETQLGTNNNISKKITNNEKKDYKIVEEFDDTSKFKYNKYLDSPINKKMEQKKKENDSSSEELDDLIDFKSDDELCPEPENTQENNYDFNNKEDDNNNSFPMEEPIIERPTIGVPPPGTNPKEYNFEDDYSNDVIFHTNKKMKYDNYNGF